MGTKDEVVSALRQLKRSHKKIRDEFALINDSSIEELLGEQYTPQLHEQMKRHGDGQSLCSYPRSMSDLESIDAVVLFGMNFPKLGGSSEFDRSTPLHEIDYWRTTVPISPKIDSRSLHFMVWQQIVGSHGVDRRHAIRNYRFLASKSQRLESLLKREKEAGIRFVLALQQWLGASGKSMILITNSTKRSFDEPIRSLIHNPEVERIETGLRSRNYKIMEKVGMVFVRSN